MKQKACIILPTYNEVDNIPVVISQIFEQAISIDSHEFHVLVVDDNSPDGTSEAVKEQMNRFPNLYLLSGNKNGFGKAYLRGFEYAMREFSPDLIFQMDADLQHSPSLLPLFITLSNYGFSLVIGSRFVYGGSTPNFSIWRRIQSLIGNWLIRVLGGVPRIRDCTSGYRCIKAELIKKCDFSSLSTRGYSFLPSFLCELLRNGAHVIEVPIVFPDRIHGGSKLSMRDRLEFLFNIFKIRFRQSEEFVKFCCVGGSGIVINMGLYFLLTRRFTTPIEIASLLAIEASILSNFILNNFWTFNKRQRQRSLLSRLLCFHAVCLAAGTTNYLGLLFFVKVLGVWDVLSNLIAIGFGVLLNYSLNSLWTWKEAQSKSFTARSLR
jgi:dolichol-phosphate mannosyltransferase